MKLIYDTLDWGRKWLVDFNDGKTQTISIDWSNNNSSIDVDMDGSALEEKSFFKMLGLTVSSKLDRALTSRLLKPPPKNWSLEVYIKFLSPEVALYHYKSTIRPCLKYCCDAWAGAAGWYLEFLDKLLKWICRTVGPSCAASLELLAHC